jgi:hypothetical protein
MKRYVFVVLLLGILTALSGTASATAQGQPAIVVEVLAGYEGAYRLGEWFPVVVTVANDGPDVRGVLEWRFAGRPDEPTFQRTIDLPRGSRKRVTLDVFARDLVHSGQLRLLDGSTVLAEQTQKLEAVDQDRFLIGVVSSDPALLNSLNALTLPSLGGAAVRHLTPAALPERPAALRSVNALFFHDVDTAALTPAQRDALAIWVGVGGQLVVSGGSAGQRTADGLADLLPVQLTGVVAQGDLTPLGQIAGSDLPTSATTTLSAAQARDGATSLLPGQDLVFRWSRGAGTVTFTTFDLAGLRGWAGEPKLWGRLLAPLDVLAPGFDARQRRLNLLQSALQQPSLGLPSAWALLAFLIGYIIVVGPLNYLVLRRLQRLEWAWLTVPATVLVFAVGLYVIGFGLRDGQSQLNQVAIVQGSEGDSRGLATAFVGLFSPRRTSYTLAFPIETMVSEARTWNDLSNEIAVARQGDTGVEVPDVLVDVGSFRTFMAEGAVNVSLSIQSDLRSDTSQVAGQIRNTGSQALEDALIVRGTAYQTLGTISPGASHRVTLGRTGNFPWGVSLSRTGLFDRQQLLAVLFEGGAARFGNPNNQSQTIDEQGVYLLAWSNTASVPTSVNGRETAQDGLTLYVIRLNNGADLPLTAPPTALPTATSQPDFQTDPTPPGPTSTAISQGGPTAPALSPTP